MDLWVWSLVSWEELHGPPVFWDVVEVLRFSCLLLCQIVIKHSLESELAMLMTMCAVLLLQNFVFLIKCNWLCAGAKSIANSRSHILHHFESAQLKLWYQGTQASHHVLVWVYMVSFCDGRPAPCFKGPSLITVRFAHLSAYPPWEAGKRDLDRDKGEQEDKSGPRAELGLQACSAMPSFLYGLWGPELGSSYLHS